MHSKKFSNTLESWFFSESSLNLTIMSGVHCCHPSLVFLVVVICVCFEMINSASPLWSWLQGFTAHPFLHFQPISSKTLIPIILKLHQDLQFLAPTIFSLSFIFWMLLLHSLLRINIPWIPFLDLFYLLGEKNYFLYFESENMPASLERKHNHDKQTHNKYTPIQFKDILDAARRTYLCLNFFTFSPAHLLSTSFQAFFHFHLQLIMMIPISLKKVKQLLENTTNFCCHRHTHIHMTASYSLFSYLLP